MNKCISLDSLTTGVEWEVGIQSKPDFNFPLFFTTPFQGREYQ